MTRHLVTTTCDVGVCRRCRTLVIVGVVDGVTTRVDPWPLDRDTEAVALISGRDTYTLTTSRRLLHRAAGLRVGHVLAEHRCGAPLPAVAQPHAEAVDACPF